MPEHPPVEDVIQLPPPAQHAAPAPAPVLAPAPVMPIAKPSEMEPPPHIHEQAAKSLAGLDAVHIESASGAQDSSTSNFDQWVSGQMSQVQEFNQQEFKNPLDAGFHRDIVGVVFSGFERLRAAQTSDAVLRQDVLSRMEILHHMQTRLAQFVWQKNAELGTAKEESEGQAQVQTSLKQQMEALQHKVEKANTENKKLKILCEEYQAQGEQVNLALGQTNQANQRYSQKVKDLETRCSQLELQLQQQPAVMPQHVPQQGYLQYPFQSLVPGAVMTGVGPQFGMVGMAQMPQAQMSQMSQFIPGMQGGMQGMQGGMQQHVVGWDASTTGLPGGGMPNSNMNTGFQHGKEGRQRTNHGWGDHFVATKQQDRVTSQAINSAVISHGLDAVVAPTQGRTSQKSSPHLTAQDTAAEEAAMPSVRLDSESPAMTSVMEILAERSQD